MARALALAATSSPTNQVLDLWTLIDGQLADVEVITWEVFDLTAGSVSVASGAVDVGGLAHIGLGHYVATWTAAGNVGLHRIVWSVTRIPAGAVWTYQDDFDVLPAGLGPLVGYSLLSEVRDEGFTSAMVSDARALKVLARVAGMIERWTRRFFEPRYRTITLDGSRGAAMYLDDPIISIAAGYVDGNVLDATSYQVANRHITEGLTNPDDRDGPRIQFQRVTRALVSIDDSFRQVFWPGPQNVQLTGLFGYTDYSPLVQVGVTPSQIKWVSLLLFAREMGQLSDPDGRADAANAYRTTSIRTRDQSITYGKNRADLVTLGAGEFTGDPAIDDIIASYMAPPFIGST